jgi:hypothetical protein
MPENITGLTNQFNRDAENFSKGLNLPHAVGYWLGYPLFFDFIKTMAKANDDEKLVAKTDLDKVHFQAVRVLMQEARNHGLDYGAIWEAGKICRDLYKSNLPKGVPDTWPSGLGNDLYQYPDIMRVAIQKGEVEFLALMNALDFPIQADPPIIREIPGMGKQIPPAKVYEEFPTAWLLGMHANLEERKVKRGEKIVDFSTSGSAWDVFVKLVKTYPKRVSTDSLWNDDNSLGSVATAVARLRNLIHPLGFIIPRAAHHGYVLIDSKNIS